MTIVPIGKLIMQARRAENREEYLRGLIGEMQEAVKEVVQRCIEAELEAGSDAGAETEGAWTQ